MYTKTINDFTSEREVSDVDSYNTISDLLVNLFNEIMDIEEKAIITKEFQDITNNDMHIIAAIGIDEPRNMTAVAKSMSVTVGTLTIAINNLVKKRIRLPRQKPGGPQGCPDLPDRKRTQRLFPP